MYDVIIIGSGPAGLMCANGLNVSNYVILEKNNESGKKLLLTGAGRCNLTNNKSALEFLENIDYNEKYLRTVINVFGPSEIISFFSKKIKLKEEKENRIFPQSDKASDVLNVLLEKTSEHINYNSEVVSIEKETDYYTVYTKSKSYKAKNVVLAVGGKSFPKTGSTGNIKNILKKISQNVIDYYPAESSIILEGKFISGLSLENVTINAKKHFVSGNLMFTKNGISGDSAMNMSGFIYRENVKEIYIDYLPNYSEDELKNVFLSNSGKEITGAFFSILSKNLIDYLFKDKTYFHKHINKFSINEVCDVINVLKKSKFIVKSLNDIKYAYASGGGVDLKYVNTKSFESKGNKGLYFIGECTDLYGPVGGYNLTIAFSTGYSAAKNINENI